jgi:hypothetical protein
MKCSDCEKEATALFHFRNEGMRQNDFKHVPRCDLHSLKDNPQAALCICKADWEILIRRDRQN